MASFLRKNATTTETGRSADRPHNAVGILQVCSLRD